MILNTHMDLDRIIALKREFKSNNQENIVTNKVDQYGFWDWIKTAGENIIDAVGTTVPPLSIVGGVAVIAGTLGTEDWNKLAPKEPIKLSKYPKNIYK